MRGLAICIRQLRSSSWSDAVCSEPSKFLIMTRCAHKVLVNDNLYPSIHVYVSVVNFVCMDIVAYLNI